MISHIINSNRVTNGMVFVGADPGLSAPGFSMLNESAEHMLSCYIDGSKDKYLTYLRAFNIANLMCKEIENRHIVFSDICLIIEGSSFSKNSASLEQLANCRQAIFDAFVNEFDIPYCIVVPPYEVKREVTGNKGGDKIDVYHWSSKAYVEVFRGLKRKAYRTITKGKNKGKKILNKKVENISDSLAIAYTGLQKWKHNRKIYEVNT